MLFDISSHRTHWLAYFRGSLPSILPSAAAAPSSAKDIVALFTGLQTQIFDAIAELQEILELHDSHLKLAREIHAKDSTLLSFAERSAAERAFAAPALVDDWRSLHIAVGWDHGNNRVQGQRVGGVPGMPRMPAATPKAPAKYAQLVINPNQDDCCSDCGSDDRSPEDDED